jgi:hypothetical protein
MKIFKLDDFVRGWFIGHFKPTLFDTKDFEIAVQKYKKGDLESGHYHKVAIEYNVIASGVFKFNEKIHTKDDIIIIEPGEANVFECLEDGNVVVVKIPSVKGDKYLEY